MVQGLTEWLQKSRLTVVEVDRAHGRLRVRGDADACSELSCGEHTVVVSDEGPASLGALSPGDIVKVESTTGHAEKIVVVRRAWDEIASPEV